MERFQKTAIGKLSIGDSFCFIRDRKPMIASKVIEKRGYITTYKRLNEIKKSFSYHKQVLFLRSDEQD